MCRNSASLFSYSVRISFRTASKFAAVLYSYPIHSISKQDKSFLRLDTFTKYASMSRDGSGVEPCYRVCEYFFRLAAKQNEARVVYHN